MPFKSEAQKRFMFAKHPKIAKKWSKEYPDKGKLPEHKGSFRDAVMKAAAKKRRKK